MNKSNVTFKSQQSKMGKRGGIPQQPDAEAKDYSFVQPVDLKNPNELTSLTKIEKQLYEEKLRLEIFEHDHRQQVYKAKRDELLEIETAYRYLQKQHEQRHSGP